MLSQDLSVLTAGLGNGHPGPLPVVTSALRWHSLDDDRGVVVALALVSSAVAEEEAVLADWASGAAGGRLVRGASCRRSKSS